MVRKSQQLRPVMTRIPEGLRHRLEREAELNRRSMNAEIIHRLEQSFRKSEDTELTADTLRAAFGDRTGDLFRAFATAIWLVEKGTGKKWHEDPDTWWMINGVFHPILLALSPTGTGWPNAGPLSAEAAAEKLRDMQFLDEKAVAGGRVRPISQSSYSAALKALQQMGMAASDAEIQEAAKKANPDEDESK